MKYNNSMSKVKYIVSACLSGEKCRYDGKCNYNERVAELVREGWATLICPEVMGGLTTPRFPCEIVGDRVINNKGKDKTSEFKYGAEQALALAQRLGIKKAILKSKSPSCGIDEIYDGSFSDKVVAGQGVTAKLLEESNLKLYSDKQSIVYDAVIVAAGSGTRTGLSYNKMFHFSGKTTVIEKAVEPFVGDFLCGKVIVVCKKVEQPMFEALLPYGKIEYAEGGSCREESVYNGMLKTSAKYVLVHDGARANVSTHQIDEVVKHLQTGNDCVIPYIEPKQEQNNDFVMGGKAMQTPQGIKRSLLIKVMEDVDNLEDYRDESSMIVACSKTEAYYIPGDERNFKITTQEDLIEWCRIHRNEE